MVTVTQLQILQSPITSLISSVSSCVSVKLDESNYIIWHFQIELLLEGHGIMGFLSSDSTMSSSDSTLRIDSDDYKIWKMHDRALMQLITATLFPSAISCAIGSTNARDLWSLFDDGDIVILTLNGLSSEYNTLRTIIRGRENVIFMKDLHLQLLAEEAMIANVPVTYFLYAMVANNLSGSSKSSNFEDNQHYESSFKNGNSSNGGLYGSQRGFYQNKAKGKHYYNSQSRFGSAKSSNFNNNAHGILGTSPPRSQRFRNTDNLVTERCQICGKRNHSAPVLSSMHVAALSTIPIVGGAGLSISHIGSSMLHTPLKPLRLNSVLYVPK
ncbi:hypothetical protein D8674_009171 [Pyrus ussuriensis x Pyrus communis]|uniref:Retrotransposon Copia-like N-terminal domain-containing protein n=1 Tax=Pyrus ussuriensis x Pyrus communis TaxID=2448454 RepID=A0A5N5HZV0_9ROSA|nr:hypothetical protein D8674_009171 [Pyrus ussuriensis x Pyrus communis]